MKNNKKGFTLVELLAVVVIMLAISVMAVSSISAAIKRNNQKQDETKQKVLESYAELFDQKYKNDTKTKIELSELKTEFSLTEEEITGSDDHEFGGCLKKIDNKWKYTETGC